MEIPPQIRLSLLDFLQVAEINKQTQVAGQNREKENKDTPSLSGHNAYTNTDEVQNCAPM